MKSLSVLILIGRNEVIKNTFLFIIAFIIINARSYAQEFQHLIGDYPFATSMELESLQSGVIKENTASGSHHFNRINHSKIGLFGRYFELVNSKENIPNYYNLQFGVSYRHYFKDEKSLGMMASFGILQLIPKHFHLNLGNNYRFKAFVRI